jgi:predicted outer membrane repeat protein
MKTFVSAILLAFTIVATDALAQATIHVNASCGNDAWTGASAVCQAPDGPKRTIQSGIDAAPAGGTVLVADGTYTGPGNKGLFFAGRALTVRSASGPETCFIDCEGSGIAFWFVADEPPEAVVEGFSIINGSGGSGGAFFCHHTSSPTIRDCILRDNTASSGGAIFCDVSSQPRIIRCRITQNRAARGGAVFFATEGISTATIVDCMITANTATLDGGALFCQGPSPVSINTVFWANTAGRDGGAVFSISANPAFVHCTIANNTAGRSGGAIAAGGSSGTPTFQNSILWNNRATDGPQLALLAVPFAGGARASVGFSDVEGGRAGASLEAGSTLLWDEGNIVADPLFVDLAGGDLRLTDGSPCIDAAGGMVLPPAIVTDLDGNPRFLDDPGVPDTGSGGPPVADIGAFEFQGTTSRFLVVRPLPGASGVTNSITAAGATPARRVYFAAGLRPGATTVPACPGLVIGMADPRLLGSSVADGAGVATVSVLVPARAQGITAILQAAQVSPCRVTGVVPFEFR